MSNEKFTPPYTAYKSLSPKLIWNKSRIRLRFEGSYLKEDKAPYTPNNVVNLFIVCKLDKWSRDLNAKFTLKNCLFRAVKLTKNADPDKYSYSGYGMDLILVHFFQFQILIGVKMSLFLELI